MLSLEKITALLGYSNSSGFRTSSKDFEPENQYTFELLQNACQKTQCELTGVQTFRVSKEKFSHTPKNFLCVTSANSVENAQQLHKLIWNIGSIPFLLVHLPNQLRLYNCFEFDKENDIFLEEIIEPTAELIIDKFAGISNESISTGNVWTTNFAKKLNPQNRIDHRLLKNLDELSKSLRKNLSPQLTPNTAHALIGKYIYIKYLRDRGILSDEWLKSIDVDYDNVVGHKAEFTSFKKLVLKLEERFNGKIFELDLSSKSTELQDQHIQLVATVFKGTDVYATEEKVFQQLTFDFANYDFEYIPVETLSIVYQQFLHAEEKGKGQGAYYTPETIAEYVLNEVDSVKSLSVGDKVLDPSCGSGVFLVLAFRRLIDKYRHENKKNSLTPEELSSLLLSSIYGVDKDIDACNVAAFSLILTMLHYVNPPELHKNTSFKFPTLLNTQILNADFFDPQLPISNLKFDWIIGNPPWFDLKANEIDHSKALEWRNSKRSISKVSVSRIEDAFAWKVLEHISVDGVIGLIMPMPSLLNAKFQKFRQLLFRDSQFERITNFSNIRYELFEGRVSMPAASWIYGLPKEKESKAPIRHYSPMAINQNTLCSKILWNVTIYESEIQYIDHSLAESGETSVWKFAQWGSHRDRSSYERLKEILPYTLQEFCATKGWGDKLPVQGPEFRQSSEKEKLKHMPEYEGMAVFKETIFNKRKFKNQCFTFPETALEPLDSSYCYCRRSGGLEVTKAPHLLISEHWGNHLIYSEKDFLIPPRQMGISCPIIDKDYLKALTVYLSSNLARYCIFFTSPVFGTYGTMNVVILKEVRKIPVPNFTSEQAKKLTKLHKKLVEEEENIAKFSLQNEDSNWQKKRQKKIDGVVYSILDLPANITLLIDDFIQNRLLLNESKNKWEVLEKKADIKSLKVYADTLRDELDTFLRSSAKNKITIEHSADLTLCRIKVLPDSNNVQESAVIELSDKKQLLKEVLEKTKEEFSPQFYLQRSIRVFSDDEILLIKPSRFMEWTPARALCDSDDVISEILRD